MTDVDSLTGCYNTAGGPEKREMGLVGDGVALGQLSTRVASAYTAEDLFGD